MTFLVDTNVLSELLKPNPDPRVVQWMRLNQVECALSALTLAEMAVGIEALVEGKRKSALLRQLRFLQEDFDDNILAFDERVAWEWARYVGEAEAIGFTPPLIDSLIAATARAWDLVMVTRNVDDFPLVDVVNPFEQPS